jgi:hypothetical protein
MVATTAETLLQMNCLVQSHYGTVTVSRFTVRLWQGKLQHFCLVPILSINAGIRFYAMVMADTGERVDSM